MVTLTGTNFVVGATTVNVAGGGVTVANVAVSSSTSLTASFVLDLVPAAGARTVTVTTAGGTSGGQPFTITLPLPGSMTFTPTGVDQKFMVPAGVVSILIQAEGGPGGNSVLAANGGDGGQTVARVSVAPGTQLTVRVGGGGQFGTPTKLAAGGFKDGGSSTGAGGGGGGGASSVRNFDTDTPLVIAGGGGGGGGASGNAFGGDGGGLIAEPGFPTPLVPEGGDPGGGGTQFAGGAGGTGKGSVTAQSGTAGMAGSGGIGGNDGSGGGGAVAAAAAISGAAVGAGALPAAAAAGAARRSLRPARPTSFICRGVASLGGSLFPGDRLNRSDHLRAMWWMATLSDGAFRFLSLCAPPPGSAAVAQRLSSALAAVPSLLTSSRPLRNGTDSSGRLRAPHSDLTSLVRTTSGCAPSHSRPAKSARCSSCAMLTRTQ